MPMKVGDKVSKVPETLYDAVNYWKMDRREHVGTVVYIHPKRRFYTVEFDINGGKIRESYTK